MKNNINYYYSLNPSNILKKKNNDYYFSIDDFDYNLIEYYGNEKSLNNTIEIMETLSNYGIYSNKIMKNNFNNYISNINNRFYILVVYRKEMKEKIKIKDIEIFKAYYFPHQKFYKDDWNTLWSIKIDYYSYQIREFKNKYPLLKDSFSYYSGYVETGINLLNNYIDGKKNNILSLSHKRIEEDYTLYDLYNPLNIIVDYSVRDICEYFKLLIFKDENIDKKVINYLSVSKLNDMELQRFFVRMLYPTFYFDKFEEIINNQLDECEMKNIIENTYKYERLIKKLYKYLYSLNILPFIEWLSY